MKGGLALGNRIILFQQDQYYLSFPSVLEVFSSPGEGILDEPPNVICDVWIPEQEERRPPRQCNSQKGKFITDSSQGLCHNQCSGAGSESPEPKLLHKFIGWAHAVGSGLSRLVTSLQSNFIGQTHSKLFRAWDFPGGFYPVPNWQTAVSVKLTGCIQVSW